MIKHMLLMACIVFSNTAIAEDNGLSKTLQPCLDSSQGITSNMLNCIGTETQQQDKRLNKAYKAVIAQLSPIRKKQLQDAQRAWLKYRDLNCTFYADPDGGTMASVMASDCVMTSTASRAKELEGFKNH